MEMHLEVLRHDGPARLGRLHHQRRRLLTPALLSTPGAGEQDSGGLMIAPKKELKGEGIAVYGSIFAGERVDRFGILPSFPAGYDAPRRIVEEAVEETIRFAEKHPGFGAVVEGGRYPDLRARCARALADRPILKIACADRLFENQRRLVEVLVAVRERISPNTALYVPDAPPHLFALLAYMGVDLFDMKRAVLASHGKLYHTQLEELELQQLQELPCSCSVCSRHAPAELTRELLLQHNRLVAEACIREVRNAISLNALRELVEARVACSPLATAALRILSDEHRSFLERYTPLFPYPKGGG